MEKNEVTVRNMKTEDQKTIKLTNLIEEIYNIIEQFGE